MPPDGADRQAASGGPADVSGMPAVLTAACSHVDSGTATPSEFGTRHPAGGSEHGRHGGDPEEAPGAMSGTMPSAAGSLGDTAGVRIPPAVRRALTRFDQVVDKWLEPLRGQPGADATAKVVANLSDHGFVWAVEAAWRARRPGNERWRALRELAVAGVASSMVNTAVKALVGRARPGPDGRTFRAGNLPVREPTSSSFPSGHTLAAFCVAAMTADRSRPAATCARFTAAGMVGWSRVHLRVHHASDVVGGMAIGAALGAAGRLLG